MEQMRQWTSHDAAVWHTRDILHAVQRGRLDRRPVLPTPFAPAHALDEAVLAQSAFELLTHRAIGDGSYQHSSGAFLATGRGGLAMTAGFFAGQAVMNGRRRRAAAQDSVPRWVVDDVGALWVSSHGFYLQTASGLFPWAWSSVQAAQLVAPRSVHLQGAGPSGPISWIVAADWAELVFVLWASARHPRHPSLARDGWVPPGWHERAAGFSPALPERTRGLAGGEGTHAL